MKRLLSLSFLFAACAGDNHGPVVGPDESISEMRGHIVTTGVFGNVPFAITEDGSHIIAIGGPQDRILSINAKNGQTQVAVQARGFDLIEAVSTVGSDIYYAQFFELRQQRSLIRMSDRIDTLTTQSSMRGTAWPADAQAVVSSASLQRVAYVAEPDSLYIYDPVLRETTFVRNGCEQVVAMSPDGDAVLCRIVQTRGYVAYDVPTGAVRTDIAIPADISAAAHEVRWTTAGIRVLFADAGHYTIYDQATDLRTPVGPEAVAPETLGLGATAWSADGNRIAFWHGYCARRTGEQCSKAQAILLLYDAASGSVQRVAVHTLSASASQTGGALAFSPDGNSLYYVANAALFVVNVF